MEISILSKGGIRLKGKQATVTVDSVSDLLNVNGALFLTKLKTLPKEELLIIDGPGDYEVGGVKVSTVRSEKDLLHSITMDGVEILVGDISATERMQTKLKEHNILLLNATSVVDVAFVASLTPGVLMLYGEQAPAVAEKTGKEGIQTMNKYAITLEKLPLEMATILLA